MFDFLPSFFIHPVFEFFFSKQLVSKSFPSFCRIMINCEDLVIVEGQVVRQLLKDSDVSPESMLPLNSFEEFENRLKFDKKLMKVYYSLKDLYEQCVQSGFKILPDKFEGFGLFNHTGRVLKPSLEPLRPFLVDPVKSVRAELQNECPVFQSCGVSWTAMNKSYSARIVSPISPALLTHNFFLVIPAPSFRITNAFSLK